MIISRTNPRHTVTPILLAFLVRKNSVAGFVLGDNAPGLPGSGAIFI
jgi:hypothetical protein